MANYAFPRIGEVTRCGVLSKSDKIPADALLGTVIAERIFDVIMLLILTIVVVFIKLHLFGQFFFSEVYQPLTTKISNFISVSSMGILVLFILLVATGFLVYAFREQIIKITFVRKIGKLGKGILGGAFTIFKIKKLPQFLIYTILMWGTYWLMTYTFFLALEPTSHLDFADALFIMVAGSYGMAAPVQAGIGAYHGVVALALSIYAISWSDGLAFALLSHGSQAIGIILMGAFALFIMFYKNKKINKAKTISGNNGNS